MAKGPRKISYIKKPLARRSIWSTAASAVALVCCGMSLGISVRMQGSGGLNVAAWGLSSLLFAIVGLCYGTTAFLEAEKNYILAKISTGVSGTLTVFWLCMILVGLLA